MALPARADDCRLKLVMSLPLATAPDGARKLVAVSINGTPEQFLLNTGGAATQLGSTAAKALNLPLTDSRVKMLDLYGNASTAAVRIENFGLGRLVDHNTELQVMNDSASAEPPFAGLLAADYMAKYDLEFDFAGGKLNYMSRDHCEGKVVYWPTTAIAAIPMVFRDHHLRIPVSLNGRTFTAIVDTGATTSTLSAAEAKRVFNLTPDMPGSKILYEDRGHKAFERIFDTLSFEGVTVNNPRITILPDLIGSRDANNDRVTGSLLKRVDDLDSSDPPMLLGMNILSKLRFYVAFSENKIYLTPATSSTAAH